MTRARSSTLENGRREMMSCARAGPTWMMRSRSALEAVFILTHGPAGTVVVGDAVVGGAVVVVAGADEVGAGAVATFVGDVGAVRSGPHPDKTR